MAAERDALQETIDRLYGLPLDEFTPARDAAVKERRAAKDREGAETLRRLRKPNLVAWSLNRVRRGDPGAIDALIAAGERLGDAQRQLIESGEHGSLRGAAADERAHVGHVAELASAELSATGHAPDAGTQSKLFATLHAAAASSEVRQQLAAGRLLRDHELSDLGLGDAAALATPSRPAPKKSGRERPDAAAPEQERRRTAVAAPEQERRRAAVAARLARARDRHQQMAEKAEQARQAAEDAERAARQAAAELTRAERAAEKAAAAAERTATAAKRAEASVSELQDELAALG